jgi:hypothetical protein
MPVVVLLRSKCFPERGIGIPEAFGVSYGVRNLRIILDHEYGPHAIRHRNATHRGEAKIGWRILWECIAKTLKLRVAVSLISGDEHRALGLETEQTAIHIGERYTANARIVDGAQNAEIAFVPVVFCGAQRNCVTRAIYDLMPKRKSARRLIDRAAIDRSVVLPFKAVMSDGAVNALRQSKVSRQIVIVRDKEKPIPLVLLGK